VGECLGTGRNLRVGGFPVLFWHKSAANAVVVRAEWCPGFFAPKIEKQTNQNKIFFIERGYYYV